MAQHLYRIGQEALSNAVRHANATKILVRLRGDDDGLVLEVEDNGEGMATGKPAEGMGLGTMAYRAHLLEGELSVVPVPAGGTRVFCRVPASVTRLNGRTDGIEKVRHEN
jgi:signal transduction histidine kinase